MKGVVLSAGFGKRLIPLTYDTPKGLLKIFGRPILEHIILGFHHAGIKDIVIVIGYLGEKIKNYFKNGEELGINIEYVWQENPNGTGSAVLLTKNIVGNSPFMLSWGDILLEKDDYLNIKRSFEKEECDIVMGINYQEDLSQGGAVFLEEKNKKFFVKNIIEKPKDKVDTKWNQTGIFILKPIIFKYLENIFPSERGEYEFTSAIKLMIDDNLIIRPYFIHNFIEIGNLEQWQKYKLQELP
jgi:dTDP-glucose pyrophosphorylase